MDKTELENGTLLSDKHIAATQMLLEKSFQHIKGFQSTLFVQQVQLYHSVDKNINGKDV